jgi:hypothetical protein
LNSLEALTVVVAVFGGGVAAVAGSMLGARAAKRQRAESPPSMFAPDG